MHAGAQSRAKRIYEEMAERIGHACVDNNLSALQSLLVDPTCARHHLSGKEQSHLKNLFNLIQNDSQDIGDLKQNAFCIWAEPSGRNQIHGGHVAEFSNAHDGGPSRFCCECTLNEIGGTWKLSTLQLLSHKTSKEFPQVQSLTPPSITLYRSDNPDAVDSSHDLELDRPDLVFESNDAGGSDLEAWRLYQNCLDHVSNAVLYRDFDQALSFMHTPFFRRTAQGLIAINTRSDHIAEIEHVNAVLRRLDATDYIRTTTHAQFIDDDTIEGQHTSRILCGTEMRLVPYENRLRLRRFEDGWKITFAEHSVHYDVGKSLNFDMSSGRLSDLNDLQRRDAFALVKYRTILRLLDQANNTQDYALWNSLFEHPYRTVLNTDQHLIDNEELDRSFFAMVSDILKQTPEARLCRRADVAVFNDPLTIRGYHTGTFEGLETPIPPIRSRITLKCRKGVWRVSEVANAVENKSFPYIYPKVAANLASETQADKDTAP